MKKKNLIKILITILLLSFVLYLILKNKKSTNKQITSENDSSISTNELPFASPVIQKPIGPTFTVSEIKINNFYNQNPKINERGDATFLDMPNFQIIYFANEKEFLISILGSPFEEARQEAESKFLEQLDITQEKACQLTVNITTPNFANPDQSGQNYRLSFCE